MLLTYFGHYDVTPPDVASWLIDHGYRDDKGNTTGATCDGVTHVAICEAGASWGLGNCNQSSSFDDLDNWLKTGPVIAHVRQKFDGECKFTNGGHYIVIVEKAEDYYVISDPNSCEAYRARGTQEEISGQCALVGFIRLTPDKHLRSYASN